MGSDFVKMPSTPCKGRATGGGWGEIVGGEISATCRVRGVGGGGGGGRVSPRVEDCAAFEIIQNVLVERGKRV